MAADLEQITEGFLEFDIEINDSDVMSKLEDIALTFTLDADELVNEWLAYQSRNPQCLLTYTGLEQFEREISSTRAKSEVKKKALTDYNEQYSSRIPQSKIDVEMVNIDDSKNAIDIIEGYCSPKNRNKLQKMNIDTPLKLKENMSPSIFSPLSVSKGSSEKYANRSNSGEVVSLLCAEENPDTTAWPNVQAKDFLIVPSKSSIKDNYKYMFQKVMDVCDILNDNVEYISQQLQSQFEEDIESYTSCSFPCQTETVIVGRIKNEHQGRLNAQSVMIEGDRVTSFGRSVNVDLEQLSQYSLFPGQVVAMKGINPTGKQFIASQILSPTYADGSLSLGKVGDFENNENCLTIMIAAGSYTTANALCYEPLKDFISVVKLHKPSVTIFVGPLLDDSHDDVKNGLIDVPLNEFANQWIDFIRNALESYTQLVFIPSERDVFHHPVFPQPCYMERKLSQTHFMGNPCQFSVGDVQIGTTAADILFHMGAEETSKTAPSSATDRLSRLVDHLFAQKSFYPLYPAHESVSMDIPAAEFGCKLSSDVDLLILPSDLKCFVKCIKGRLCINPGRLVKGIGGGTYAKVVIDCAGEKKAMAQVVKI